MRNNEEYTMEPATREVYLVAHWDKYDHVFTLGLEMWKPGKSSEQVLLETFTVARGTDLSHNQLVQMQLNKLDEVDGALAATYHMDKKDVEDKRQTLLAITHQPEEQEVESAIAPDPSEYNNDGEGGGQEAVIDQASLEQGAKEARAAIGLSNEELHDALDKELGL